MDEATLAGIERTGAQWISRLARMIAASREGVYHPENITTDDTGAATRIYAEEVEPLVDAVRRLSAALAHANKTIRALVAAAPSGEPRPTAAASAEPKETPMNGFNSATSRTLAEVVMELSDPGRRPRDWGVTVQGFADRELMHALDSAYEACRRALEFAAAAPSGEPHQSPKETDHA